MISIGLCSCQYGMWFDDNRKEREKKMGIGCNVRVVIIINDMSMYACLKILIVFLLGLMFIISIIDFT